MSIAKGPKAKRDDYPGDNRIEFLDGAAVDAFGRQRVSVPMSEWGYTNQYGANSVMIEQWVVGTGNSSHDPNNSAVIMTTGGTGSGAKCSRQTRQYFRYVPGKSMLILQTGTLGAAKANVRQRRGYFDDNNGVFFEQTVAGMSVVLRSFSTGAAVDTAILQANWNVDKFDGIGPSGIVFDSTKVQVFVIDLQWLGAGRVRYGFSIGGQTYYCHEIMNANVITTTYMTTANLPLRAEIENTGVAASTTTMSITCATVIIEGDGDRGGYYDHAVGNGITTIGVTTRRAVLSIRPKATFNSIVNRAVITPQSIQLIAATNNSYYEVVYGGTLGGSPAWTSAGANSTVEYDVAGTTVTGGEVIASGFIVSGQGQSATSLTADLATQYPIVLDHAGANPINLSIVCTSFTATSTVSAAINYHEYY
jgi:hypothetical protein